MQAAEYTGDAGDQGELRGTLATFHLLRLRDVDGFVSNIAVEKTRVFGNPKIRVFEAHVILFTICDRPATLNTHSSTPRTLSKHPDDAANDAMCCRYIQNKTRKLHELPSDHILCVCDELIPSLRPASDDSMAGYLPPDSRSSFRGCASSFTTYPALPTPTPNALDGLLGAQLQPPPRRIGR